MTEWSEWLGGLPHAHPRLAIALTIGLTMGVLSLVKRWLPAPLRILVERLQAAAHALVRALARVVTAVVLACGYVVAITPVALWWKVTRRDVLRRRAFTLPQSRWHSVARIENPTVNARRQF